MTEHERQQAFLQALDAIQKMYGFTVQPQAAAENLGEALLIRAKLVLVALPDWQPMQATGSPAGTISDPLPTPPIDTEPKFVQAGVNGA